MADRYRYYTYTIERVEDELTISGRASRYQSLRDVVSFVCDRMINTIAVGKITEIKINLRRDGSVFVSVLCATDRIFAWIKEVHNG